MYYVGLNAACVGPSTLFIYRILDLITTTQNLP